MKLISLNTYGGCFFDPLLAFIKTQATDADIFCFQEVLTTSGHEVTTPGGSRANLFFEMSRALSDFTGWFIPSQDQFDFFSLTDLPIQAGLATFVRKKYSVAATGDFFIYRERNSFDPSDPASLPYGAHYVQLQFPNKLLTICNVHGTSEPGTKLDTPERLKQSQKILDFVNRQPGEKIITGDFNLFPNTRSIAMFEEGGFRNLIKDFAIPTTRGSLVKKLHPEYGTSQNGWQEFADYAFISSGVTPKNFTVPDLPISDHLPMILEFELR